MSSSESQGETVPAMRRLEELYRKHVQAVFRFALGCVSRREVAEDLTSEAFLALQRHLDRIEPSLLPGWLFTVVRNRARDHWRRQVVEQRYRAALPQPVFSEPLPLERWLLEGAHLKPVHRTCLMLRYVQGMTRAEIASATGLSVMQVKGNLQYGLAILRKTYNQAAAHGSPWANTSRREEKPGQVKENRRGKTQ